MISRGRQDTRSHQYPKWVNNEKRDWRPCWPSPLWSLARRDGLWVVSVRHKERWGLLLNSVTGGALALGHAHLSVKLLSWVKVLRREAAWRHSALTRACSRLSREAHVCRDKHTRRLETEMWVARIAYSKWWHLSFYCDLKQMQYWNSWTLAHIQIIGFPWINRCRPFTARTPDCLHKIFLPLSSWNVFTGNNNNSKIIAMKRTGNENELTKLAMNGIPTPCELNRSLIAQSFCVERDKFEHFPVAFLTHALHFCGFSHFLLSAKTGIIQHSIFASFPQTLC